MEEITYEKLVDASQRCRFEKTLEKYNRSRVKRSETCQDVTYLTLLVVNDKVVSCGYRHVGCIVSKGAIEMVCGVIFNEPVSVADLNLLRLKDNAKKFMEEKPHRASCVLNAIDLANQLLI